MAASDAFRIKAAQDIGAQGGLISLHSAAVDCSSTANANATEVSGGGYTRKTTAWGTPWRVWRRRGQSCDDRKHPAVRRRSRGHGVALLCSQGRWDAAVVRHPRARSDPQLGG